MTTTTITRPYLDIPEKELNEMKAVCFNHNLRWSMWDSCFVVHIVGDDYAEDWWVGSLEELRDSMSHN